MAITYVQHIDAPVETVFDFLDDDRKLKTWMEGLEDTIYLADYDRANPVGARFTQRIREGGRITEYDGEVTAYSRPHRLAVKLWSKNFTVDVDYLLHAEHGGTRLDYSADLKHATTVARVMGTLFGWLTRHILVNQMSELKRVAEEAAAAAPRAAYATAEAAHSTAEAKLEPGPEAESELEQGPVDGSELEPAPVAESELEPEPEANFSWGSESPASTDASEDEAVR